MQGKGGDAHHPGAGHALTTGPSGPFLSTIHPSTMRTTLISATLCAALLAGFWYALTSTLTDLTIRDCKAGALSACAQLQKDGVQL